MTFSIVLCRFFQATCAFLCTRRKLLLTIMAWGTGVVTCACLPPQAAMAGTCTPQAIDTIPLIFKDRHYFVQTKINGQDVDLVVDTGAQTTLVTSALVEALGIARASHYSVVVSQGGRGTPERDAILSSLVIGKLSLQNWKAMVEASPSVATKFQGILGADVLLRGPLELDFPNKAMTIYAPSPCSDISLPLKPPYLSVPAMRSPKTGRILFGIAINGHAFKALLDSGASSTAVDRNALLEAGFPAAELDTGHAVEHHDANGFRSSVQQVHFRTVQIGHELFHDAPLNVANQREDEGDAFIGLDYFQRRIVWLSESGRSIFIVQPSHVIPSLRTTPLVQ